MPKIIYIQPDDASVEVSVPVGWTLMEGAVKNGIKGIVAECAGSCACATCHVYIDSTWLSKLSYPAEMESEMLECTAEEATAESRLSCQVKVQEEMDGMVVRLPAEQL